jgi:histidine ammonia-lyase
VLRGFRLDDIEDGEANPVANGSPVSAALAADAALRAVPRLGRAERALALSAAAFGVPADAYAEELGELWGDPDEAAALAALRRHLSGAPPGRRQASQVPASYLILGRVLGQAHRAVAELTEAARVSLRSVTDNPVYVAPDAAHPLGQALSTGGFHNAMAYPALNALAAVWADLTLLAGRHVTALRAADPAEVPAPELSALAEEARAAAMPTLLPAAVNDPQDDVSSPVFGAYRREATAAECLDGAIALLAAKAGRSLDAAGRPPAPPVRDPLQRVRAARKGPDPA